jgi:hydrogenase small subunit
MEITRRDFLKYAAGAAVALGLTKVQLANVERVLADSSSPAVIWLQGAACTGCSVSLLNTVNPTIDQLLLNNISLKYHTTLMSAAGDMAVAAARSTQQAGGYILAIEGAIPTANNGKYCYVWDENGAPVTMADAVTSLAANAAYIVAVGTCASYGGIPAVNTTAAAKSVSSFLGRPVVNLPGCPAHPDWVVGTLVQVLSGTVPELDSNGRPTLYYPESSLHSRCPRRGMLQATTLGEDYLCLQNLGCKGPSTHSDCEARKWNNGQNWCIGVNGPCIGCTEPDFPAFPLRAGSVIRTARIPGEMLGV